MSDSDDDDVLILNHNNMSDNSIHTLQNKIQREIRTNNGAFSDATKTEIIFEYFQINKNKLLKNDRDTILIYAKRTVTVIRCIMEEPNKKVTDIELFKCRTNDNVMMYFWNIQEQSDRQVMISLCQDLVDLFGWDHDIPLLFNSNK